MEDITDISAVEIMDTADTLPYIAETTLKRKHEDDVQLTKRQLRKQAKKDKWEAWKPQKRANERAKMKLKRATARMNNITLGPSRKALHSNKMANSECKVHIAIDMSFDDIMTDKDIAKCNKQILRCYSSNRRTKNPIQFHITSLEGKSLEEMKKHNGYENWDVNFHVDSYMKLFGKEDLVYLTSESENVITKLENNKVYIIGGLVDHNSQKGICHTIAIEQGISHAQLPLGELMDMKTRKVLAITHVFEILIAVTEGSTWQDAFLKVLPQRKGGTAKTDSPTTSDQIDKDVRESILQQN